MRAFVSLRCILVLPLLPTGTATECSFSTSLVQMPSTASTLPAVEDEFPGLPSVAHVRRPRQACQCLPFDPSWRRPLRTLQKCIYIDLGAADGNSFRPFLKGRFGSLEKCGTSENSGEYEAFLLEANPRFDSALQSLEQTSQKRVRAMNSTAVYMCDAQASFYLDPDVEHNFWGSSLDGKVHRGDDWRHPHDAPELRVGQQLGEQKITVPTVNLMRLLYENAIPGDLVIVKMDIEGAEWDIVPCLASSPAAALVDKLFIEQHPIGWQLGNTTQAEMNRAKAKLRQGGIFVPFFYHSHSL